MARQPAGRVHSSPFGTACGWRGYPPGKPEAARGSVPRLRRCKRHPRLGRAVLLLPAAPCRSLLPAAIHALAGQLDITYVPAAARLTAVLTHPACPLLRRAQVLVGHPDDYEVRGKHDFSRFAIASCLDSSVICRCWWVTPTTRSPPAAHPTRARTCLSWSRSSGRTWACSSGESCYC